MQIQFFGKRHLRQAILGVALLAIAMLAQPSWSMVYATPATVVSNYNRTAVVQWAETNNYNDGSFRGTTEGRYCTTFVGRALNAGGLNALTTWTGTGQLVRWMLDNPSSWEDRPLDQLIAGDFVLYSELSNAPDNWSYIDPTEGWSLWGHSALVIAPNKIAAWNAERYDKEISYYDSTLPYNKGVHILTNQPPNQPTQITPIDGTIITTPNLTLQVQDGGDPDNQPRDYRDFQFHIEKIDSPWTLDSSWITNTWAVILPSNGTYRWQAQSGDGEVGSGMTDWWRLTYTQTLCYTLTADVAPDTAGTIALDPQPNCTTTLAALNTPRAATTTLAQYQYTDGTVVNLTATPNTGYTFSQWSGDVTGTTSPISITVTVTKNVVANFAPVCYSLMTGVTPTGSGSISVAPPPNCNGIQYTAGTTITLNALPSAGYAFQEWLGNLSGTTSPTSLVMDSEKNIAAIFKSTIPGPARLAASDNTFASYILVDWSAVVNATNYQIYRSTTNDPLTATLIASVGRIMRYEDRTATAGTTYYYWVQALTSQGPTAYSPSDYGSFASTWQSDPVNWQVNYGNNWTRIANITKPGATNIRVHFSQITLGAGDRLSTSTGDNWTGTLSNVYSRATTDRNSLSVALFSGASGSGSFVIDRIEFQGTSAGSATWVGDLVPGSSNPTSTPTPWLPPIGTPTNTPTVFVPPAFTPTIVLPTIPPGGQLQPARTNTLVPSTAIQVNARTFAPNSLRITRGTTVTWRNVDTVAHTIVSGTPARRTNVFNPVVLAPGQSFTFTFPTAGIYTYFDEKLGTQMQGTITVQ